MSASLLVTKFYFPAVRSGLVPRKRLVERLNLGLQGPLTLIAAPAGYGKTTLMAEWRSYQGDKIPVAWLSLDSSDNQFHTFLTYLTAALDSLEQDLTANTRLLLQSEQPLPSTSLLTELINDLDHYEIDFVLALDDCHVITNPEVSNALDFLVSNTPHHMHLVLLSRSDPELPLARLRALSQMVEIRAEHLRFTIEEAAYYLTQVMGLDLTRDQVAALETRSEGWIVGLHMAALSMQGRSKENIGDFVEEFTGSHRYIMDYLVSDVLTNQPEAIQDFLLKTSILERFNARLCQAITGQTNSQEILQALEGANLFLIPLDDERGWYRYHHLFADVLRNRLKVEMPGQAKNLHRQAAKSLEQNGLFFEAIEHALNIPDYDFVRDLCRRSYKYIMRTENRAAVIQVFTRLPRTYFQIEPWMSVLYAWIVWGEGKMEPAEEMLEYAHKAYQRLLSEGRLPAGDLEYEGLPAEILAFKALIHSQKNDPDRVIQLADQALACVPERAPVISAVALLAKQVAYRQKGEMDKAIAACLEALPLSRAADDIGTRVSVLHSLGVGLMIQGKLSQLIQAYQEGLQFAQSQNEIDHPRYDLIFFKLADVAYIHNELDQAEKWLNEGFKRSDGNTNLWPRFYGKVLQIQLMLAKGDHNSAQNLLTEMERSLDKVKGAYFEAELVANVMLIRMITGNLAGVRTWAQSCQNLIQEPLNYIQLEPALQLAYTWEALDELEHALHLAAQLEAISSESCCQHLQIYALVPQIKAWAKKGNQVKAQECLARALSLAQQEGYIRVFLDHGEILRQQLEIASNAPQTTAMEAYIRRLLRAFEPQIQPLSPTRQPLISPLSERELEVLALIAAGHSNKGIASELVIAIGTVKRHTVNIFNKLDVKNRTEAVAKARDLGLL